jgi:uncharacterized protein YlxW (UPF0749 family)|tara:strand:+ start:1122 stop:1346 length:225 start_codon:yes stop_codon:yes gene_type:complete
MSKRKKSKRWIENNIEQLTQSVNNLYNSVNSIGNTLSMYIEMKKDVKKLRKYIDKKFEQLKKENNDGKDSKENV